MTGLGAAVVSHHVGEIPGAGEVVDHLAFTLIAEAGANDCYVV